MKHIFTYIIIGSLFFVGCKKEGCTDSEALNFDSKAQKDDGSCRYESKPSGIEFSINSTMGKNKMFGYNQPFEINNGLMIEFTLAQMYIGNLKLTNGRGEQQVYNDNYPLINPTDSVYYMSDLTPGDYSNFSFGFGIDSLINNTKQPQDFDTDNTLSYQDPSMHWGWAQKYIFVKLEGKYDSDGDNIPDAVFQYHVGDDKYYTQIDEYIMYFDVLSGSVTRININVNWSNFLNGLDIKNTPKAHVTNATSDQIISNIDDVFY